MSEFLLAYAAGLVVLLNPCVLPVLPILIGSALNEGRYGPLALTAGLVLSFCLFGFFILTIGFEIGLSPETARQAAAVLPVVRWPRAQTGSPAGQRRAQRRPAG